MKQYGPIVVLLLLFCGAFVFSPETAPVGDVSAPLRAAPSDSHATRIFHGGPVITMDAQGRVAEALATRDGVIVDVGDERTILRLLGPDTQVVDLHGKALVPGFIDVAGRFESSADTAATSEEHRARERQVAMHGYTTLHADVSETPTSPAAAPPPILVPDELFDTDTFHELDALTRGAAHRTHEEESRGTLEPGKLADMVVVSAPSLSRRGGAGFEVLETIKGGSTVYRR